MSIREMVAARGGVAAVAYEMGVTPATVAVWASSGTVAQARHAFMFADLFGVDARSLVRDTTLPLCRRRHFNPVADLIYAQGGPEAVAARIGLEPHTVKRWVATGSIPRARAVALGIAVNDPVVTHAGRPAPAAALAGDLAAIERLGGVAAAAAAIGVGVAVLQRWVDAGAVPTVQGTMLRRAVDGRRYGAQAVPWSGLVGAT